LGNKQVQTTITWCCKQETKHYLAVQRRWYRSHQLARCSVSASLGSLHCCTSLRAHTIYLIGFVA